MAGKAFERFTRLQRGVGSTELRLLQCGGNVAPFQRSVELLALVADHHDRALEIELGKAVEQVEQHRPPGDRVQDLMQVALHTGSLACSKDDGGEFAGSVHGAEPCHQSLAV